MTVATIDEKFKKISLKAGKHMARASGMCAMELVAYMAGEEHTDTHVKDLSYSQNLVSGYERGL